MCPLQQGGKSVGNGRAANLTLMKETGLLHPVADCHLRAIFKVKFMTFTATRYCTKYLGPKQMRMLIKLERVVCHFVFCFKMELTKL